MSQSDSSAAPTTSCVAWPTAPPYRSCMSSLMRFIGATIPLSKSFIVLTFRRCSAEGDSMLTESRAPSRRLSSISASSFVPGITFRCT